MKTNETSTRELALKWWNYLSDNDLTGFKESKASIIFKHLGNVPYEKMNSLTGREIEEIWRKEPKEGSDREIIEEVFPDLKPNQKQYKQFDESLFKSYIDKFDELNKIKAFKVLWNQLNLETQELIKGEL